MYLISYIRGMKEKDTLLRNVYWTKEFTVFYNGLSDKVREKFDYVIQIVRTSPVVSAKFVKHLENTDLYEMRVSVGGNEYRTIMFTMDNEDAMQAREITLLNAFIKKSTKDYRKQIIIAENILKRISYEENED